MGQNGETFRVLHLDRSTKDVSAMKYRENSAGANGRSVQEYRFNADL
jgi:hypothetical protein